MAQKKYGIPAATVEVTIKYTAVLREEHYPGIDSREAMIKEEYGLLTGDPAYLNDAFVHALENAERPGREVTVTVKEK